MRSRMPGRAAASGAGAQGALSAGPVRLFESDFLEWFTRINLATLVTFWVVVAAALLLLGIRWGRFGWGEGALIALAAAASWTLFEYLMHRFLFHIDRFVPRTERLAFLAHGCHHSDPADPGRDIMPLVMSLPVFLMLLGAGVLLAGWAFAFLFFGVFALCYLAYDVTHFACHQWRLRGRIGGYVRRHHLAHHYAEADRNFGVSTPLWDWVFGTLRGSRRHG